MRQTCETDRPDRVADLFADFALRGVDDRLTFLDPHLPFRKPDFTRIATAMNDGDFSGLGTGDDSSTGEYRLERGA